MEAVTTHGAARAATGQTVDEKRRNAIKGAFFSEFIDMFDIYLPVVVLAPVLFFFQPPHLAPGMEAILASLVFITTLLGRPIGALLFVTSDSMIAWSKFVAPFDAAPVAIMVTYHLAQAGFVLSLVH